MMASFTGARSANGGAVLVHRIQNARLKPQCAVERRSFFGPRAMLMYPLRGELRCLHTPAQTPWLHLTHSRSRHFAKLDDRQVSSAFNISNDERQLRSALPSDRRLRRGARPCAWPVPARFESRPDTRRPKAGVDFPGRSSAQCLTGAVLVVPHGVSAKLTSHRLKPQRN